MSIPLLLLLATFAADPLPSAEIAPGDHVRKIVLDKQERNYLVHVPKNYDPSQPTPVVLVLHGAGMNANLMVCMTGMHAKSDEAGFIAVYPNGTGLAGVLLTWNAGGFLNQSPQKTPDDVAFIAHVLDDLATVANVDAQRVFATGISNGGMMCYRLAAELSNRIAAIAPVAGTLAIAEAKPERPVSIMHFHGLADWIVPYEGIRGLRKGVVRLRSVAETIRIWQEINECPAEPVVTELPDLVNDGTSVVQKFYGPGKAGTEIFLYEIEGGGHAWPGQKSLFRLIGKSTLDISANDLMWDFFKRHPLD